MSDDEKVKKDKLDKQDETQESEPIAEEPKEEAVKPEETKTEEPSKEAPAEPTEEEKVEEEPVIEAQAVEEPIAAPEPEPTYEPEPEPEPQSTNNVVQPDQVINENNNYNNNYNNYNNNNGNANTSSNANTGKDEEPPKKKGMAIWCLILAVVGFFTGWLVIGGLFDLIAIILAIVVLAKKKDGKGLAIAGLIIAIFGIIGAIIAGIVLLAVGIPVLAVLGIASNYEDIVDTGEELYNYAYNIVEEVNNEYDFDNYIFNYANTLDNTTSSNSISNTTNTTSSGSTAPSAEEHNKFFETTIGTGNSSTKVHTFLIGIQTNNMTTTRAQKVGVCYVTSSDSYKKNDKTNTTIDSAALKENGVYLDYCKSVPTEAELDSMNFTCNTDDISAISKHLDTSKKYTVKVANSKEYVSTEAKDTGFTSSIAKGSTGGVYDSGYYRLIYIYEEN